MKVIVEFDYPTIEGMIYKDTKVKVEESEFNSKQHDEKVKGLDDIFNCKTSMEMISLIRKVARQIGFHQMTVPGKIRWGL